jgi:hypothetical protein
MSFRTIGQSVYDSPLRERIIASTTQEAWNNPAAYDTQYGQAIRTLQENGNAMIWAVCTATDVEAAYEYALNSGNLQPGADEGVITDGMILSSVQARWPQDPVPPPVINPEIPRIDNELPPEG